MVGSLLLLCGFVFVMDLLFVSAVVCVLNRAKARKERKEVMAEIRKRKEEQQNEVENKS